MGSPTQEQREQWGRRSALPGVEEEGLGPDRTHHGGVVEEGTGLTGDAEHQTLVATVEDVVRQFT